MKISFEAIFVCRSEANIGPGKGVLFRLVNPDHRRLFLADIKMDIWMEYPGLPMSRGSMLAGGDRNRFYALDWFYKHNHEPGFSFIPDERYPLKITIDRVAEDERRKTAI